MKPTTGPTNIRKGLFILALFAACVAAMVIGCQQSFTTQDGTSDSNPLAEQSTEEPVYGPTAPNAPTENSNIVNGEGAETGVNAKRVLPYGAFSDAADYPIQQVGAHIAVQQLGADADSVADKLAPPPAELKNPVRVYVKWQGKVLHNVAAYKGTFLNGEPVTVIDVNALYNSIGADASFCSDHNCIEAHFATEYHEYPAGANFAYRTFWHPLNDDRGNYDITVDKRAISFRSENSSDRRIDYFYASVRMVGGLLLELATTAGEPTLESPEGVHYTSSDETVNGAPSIDFRVNKNPYSTFRRFMESGKLPEWPSSSSNNNGGLKSITFNPSASLTTAHFLTANFDNYLWRCKHDLKAA